MKTGRSLKDLAIEVERQHENKVDLLVGTRNMAVSEQESPRQALLSVMEGPSDQGFTDLPMSDVALQQLCGLTKIPIQYARRMLVDTPDLFADNANAWLDHVNKTQMVRILDDQCRAIVSDRYQRIDNIDILKQALPPLVERMGSKELNVVSCEITPSKLYLKIADTRLTAKIKEGDIVQGGVVITNSEVGQGACQIAPMIYRLICSNGMVSADTSYRRHHVGARSQLGEHTSRLLSDEAIAAEDHAILLQIRDVVSGAFDEAFFRSTVDQLIHATEVKLRDVPKTVEVLKKTVGLTDDEGSGIIRHLIEGGDPSQYGLIQAITAYSQEIVDYDRASDFEKLGGKVLDMPQHEVQRILVAA